jgi:hypothetical protein
MVSGDGRLCACDGWWEQDWYGRQPMENLSISFDGGRIQGSGFDIIGPFTLDGVIDQNGGVAILKQYIEQHSVDYLGRCDGEGTMTGEWRIGASRGRWMISIRRFEPGERAEIVELVPQAHRE